MKKIIFIAFLLLGSIFYSTAQNCEAWFYYIQDSTNFQQISFLDGSSPQNDIIAWTWDFGDGFSSNVQNPTHTYNSNGDYSVELVIETAICSDTIVEILNVTDTISSCFTDFIYLQDEVDPLTFDFIGGFESDNMQGLTWLWDFGDGVTSLEQNPTHTFERDSAYQVTLYVSTDFCSSITEELIPTGTYYWGDECLAMFSYSLFDPAGLTFGFYDESWAGVDSLYSVLWDFGDGETSTDKYPVHTFQSEGIYDVKLTIETQNCTDFYSITIFAGEDVWYPDSCQAMFYFEQNISNPYEIKFSDLSVFSGSNNFWFWDFGDGEFDYSQNPTHIYDFEGTYVVSLEITSDTCSNIFSIELIIDEDSVYANELEALFFPEYIDENTVEFHNISQGNIIDRYWDFGDGTYSTEHSPIHDFDEVGIHEIALSIGNETGANTIVVTIDYSSKSILSAVSYPGGNFLTVSEISTSNLIIYPNPTSDLLFFELGQETECKVQIINLLGQIILSKSIGNQNSSIKVSSLPQGIYFVKTYSKNSSNTATFVKK